MNSSRRRAFKLLGFSAISVTTAASLAAVVSQSSWLLPEPQGTKKALITDPAGDNFIYVNGYIVRAENQ